MNRHLHNAMLACSAAGLVLLTGLIAAVAAPPQLTQSASGAPAPTHALVLPAATDTAQADAAAIQARARAFEARIAGSASAAEILAETAAFTAAIATETALVAAFDTAADDAAAQARADRQHRRQVRRSRAALALPYFSFAQGLRRNRS